LIEIIHRLRRDSRGSKACRQVKRLEVMARLEKVVGHARGVIEGTQNLLPVVDRDVESLVRSGSGRGNQCESPIGLLQIAEAEAAGVRRLEERTDDLTEIVDAQRGGPAVVEAPGKVDVPVVPVTQNEGMGMAVGTGVDADDRSLIIDTERPGLDCTGKIYMGD